MNSLSTIKSFKIYKNLFIVFLGFPFLFSSCSSDRSKSGEHRTYRLCDGRFFVESFTIFGGGGWGGDRVSDYLTDSVNFRMYLGTYDNAHEAISTQCKRDSVYIYFRGTSEMQGRSFIPAIRRYSVSDLKRNKIFE
jgi:hypothetical protein